MGYFPEVPDADKAAWLARVDTALAPDRLPPTHPLNALWRFGDRTSAAELFTLGRAIERVEPKLTSPKILRDLASRDEGTRVGASFELVLSSLLQTQDQSVEMAPKGNPGCDLRVHLRSGKRLRV